MKAITLGIIGGTGKMGKLFSLVLKKHVDKILVSSLDSQLTNQALVEQSDVILISVPIASVETVIESITPYVKAEHLLLDVTSLKQKPCAAMLKTQAAVIGMHPVFGPSLLDMKDQTIVLCPTRPKNWLPWLTDILRKEQVKLIDTTPETHDKMMAIIQCLVHFTSLIFVDSIKQQDTDIKTLNSFASPVYRLQALIAGRIANQSVELYRDIEFQNPAFLEVLDYYEASFKKLRHIVKTQDKDGFEQFFNNIGDYLGNLKQEGQMITDIFIKDLQETIKNNK